VAGSYKQSNEPSGSVKGGEFLRCMSDYQFLNSSVALDSVAGVNVASNEIRR
jgi:hypothetical protein